jgi:hypothetical protein
VAYTVTSAPFGILPIISLEVEGAYLIFKLEPLVATLAVKMGCGVLNGMPKYSVKE